MAMNARPTNYKEYLFRSALEARWAAFLDKLLISWSYEPFELGSYIPDFVAIYPQMSHLVEIKPALTLQDMVPALEKAADTEYQGTIVCVGADWRLPHARWGDRPLHQRTCGLALIAGEMVPVYLTYCPKCQQVVFASLSRKHRNCPNCKYQNLDLHELMDDNWYQKRWAEAHRLTRWEPSSDWSN